MQVLGQLLGSITVLELFFNTHVLTSPVSLRECSIMVQCAWPGIPYPQICATAPKLILKLGAPRASNMQQCHPVAAQPTHTCAIPRNPTKLLFEIK